MTATYRSKWEDGSCDCKIGPWDDEVVYDFNLSPRCPKYNVALGGNVEDVPYPYQLPLGL